MAADYRHHERNVTKSFGPNSIRIVMRDGNPWFVALDVCRALGMNTSKGSGHWVRHLDECEHMTTTMGAIDPHLARGSMGRGGVRAGTQVAIITEAGLYKLVLRSDKPEARKFQWWVTHDVLPTIRKDGGYIVGEEKVASGD